MTEREIIDLIMKRDESGLSELLKHYRPMIRYIITPILHNAQDQEECISEIMMKVWDNISVFDEKKSGFRTWLTAISRNTALNCLRKNSKYEIYDNHLEGLSIIKDNPEELIIRKEMQKELHILLQKLSDREKILFYRKYYYMQPTAQIAREMGMTVRAVEGKLYRIKQKLRRQMGGWEYDQ